MERFVAEHTLSIVKAHSSRLMPAIDQILKWADLTVHDLDACAVGIGPGSFTGIRIGVGTIKSLCYALKKPIIGVSTLEAIAYSLRYTDKLICPILDARKDEVYGAVFRGGQNLLRESDDLCVPIEALLNQTLTTLQSLLAMVCSDMPQPYRSGSVMMCLSLIQFLTCRAVRASRESAMLNCSMGNLMITFH